MAFSNAAARKFVVLTEPRDGDPSREGRRPFRARNGAAKAANPAANVFAINLRARRTELGMSQRTVAEQLDISKVTVWKWECGQTTPSRNNLWRLAAVLKTTPQQLLFGEDQTGLQADDAANMSMQEMIIEAKRRIAAAAGIPPDKVTISVEY